MKHIPGLVKLQDKPGLHIFTFVSPGEADKAKELMKSKGATFPVGSPRPRTYKGTGALPCAWVIGVDGTVVFTGHPGAPGKANFSSALRAELEKVKYPGLGLTSVEAALEPSAQLFVDRKYAESWAAATAVLAAAAKDSEIAKQADHILERIRTKADGLKKKATMLIEDKQYIEALEVFNEIETSFEGMDEARAVATTLEKLKQDSVTGKEISAAIALRELETSTRDMSAADRAKLMAKFADDYEGTEAARRVSDELDNSQKKSAEVDSEQQEEAGEAADEE